MASDRDRVRQVLTNLLENAIKYSPEGGRGGRRLFARGHDPLLRSRRGIGIPEDERKRIFDKFYRLDPQMAGGVGGTGLGLYICNELVQRMGGRIWVESAGESGSVFQFEVPASETTPARPVMRVIDAPGGWPPRSTTACGGGHRQLSGVLLVVCSAALFAPTAARADAADVAALQVALRQRGVHRGAVDGVFGPETRAAVRRFQRRKARCRRRPWTSDAESAAPLCTASPWHPGDPARDGRLGRGGSPVPPFALRPACRWDRRRVRIAHGWSRAGYQRRAGLTVNGVAGEATVVGLRRQRGCHAAHGAVRQGVTVAGLRVGGLSAQRAESALRSAYARGAPARAWETLLAEPNALARPQIRRAVRGALHARAGKAVRLHVDVSRAGVGAYATAVNKRVCTPPVDAKVVGLHDLRPKISRARLGCRVVRVPLEKALARRLRGLDRSVIRVRTERLSPTVTRANFGPIVVVRRGSHRLHLFRGLHAVRAMPVATGRPGNPTPLGRFTIITKIRRPWWYPPPADWAEGLSPIPPGPGEPTRNALDGAVRTRGGIHGTPDAASVGYSRSHGCVRMFPHQAEWLFRRVHVGTTVFIAAA